MGKNEQNLELFKHIKIEKRNAPTLFFKIVQNPYCISLGECIDSSCKNVRKNKK